MKIILLGAPGAGKGTQADTIKAKYGVPQISTGDILRQAVRDGTEVGKKAKSFMDAGKLVPDEIIMDIMKARLNQPDCSKGYILDGFPRTINQAEKLGKISKVDIVININVSSESLLQRLTGRRSCPKCGASYHLLFNPPPQPGKCKCGGVLIQRDDDKEETVRKRLETYQNQTAPLIEYYLKKKLLKHVDGNKKPAEVSAEVLKVLEKH
ncbi:MAG: adenylate kinase [Candidatus Helarchaeota archaeon]|nr:adenylate kinase [Candidatus Helarchaeota archaeon]